MKKVFLGIVATLFFAATSYAQNSAPQMTDTLKILIQPDRFLTFGISGKFFYELNAAGEFERLDVGKELTTRGLQPVAVGRPKCLGGDCGETILLIFKDGENRIYQASYYFNRGYTTWNGF